MDRGLCVACLGILKGSHLNNAATFRPVHIFLLLWQVKEGSSTDTYSRIENTLDFLIIECVVSYVMQMSTEGSAYEICSNSTAELIRLCPHRYIACGFFNFHSFFFFYIFFSILWAGASFAICTWLWVTKPSAFIGKRWQKNTKRMQLELVATWPRICIELL